MLSCLLAVLAACANATFSVLQHNANREVPRSENLREMVINYLTVAERFAAQVGGGPRAARTCEAERTGRAWRSIPEMSGELSGRQLVVEQLDDRVRPVRRLRYPRCPYWASVVS